MPRIRQINPNIKYFPPRQLRKLTYISQYPLTLIEAPSGFGKTTLLDYFFQEQLPETVPHYSYDFESDEPLYIWRQVCRQIGKLDPQCGERLRQCGQPDEDNLREIGEVLRDLDCPQEAYLWLDNYKRWNNPFAPAFLRLLSRHGGKGLHVIVTTQPLPVSRERVQGNGGLFWQMWDEDLTFHREDIAAYFMAAGIPLSDGQVDSVYTLTEGWIMALSLQMLCYLDRGEFEQGGMMALMEHTFWDRLSQEERDFLLKLSIFPKVSLAQATALSGLGGEKTEQILRDKRYFIHFDAENRCFYPHYQLRDLLKEHFGCLPPEEQKAIYLRAAELSEQERSRLNTLRFYYAAGEWERILELPITSYEIADVMNSDARPMVLNILEQTPMEVKRRHPRAMMTLAFALFVAGETGKLMESRGELQTIIGESDLPPEEKNALMGEMELLLSFLEYNRISDMSARHQKALRLLGGPARLISPRSVWTFGSPSIFYLYWRESGKLDEELREMDTCMPIYYRLANNHGCGAELVMRAEVHMVRGELKEALPLCYHALFVANQYHQDSIYQCGLALLCQIAFLQGDQETMDSNRASLREVSKRHREDLSRYTCDLIEGFLALERNRPEEVPSWLAQGSITEKRLVMMVQPWAYIVYGRCLLEARDYLKLLGVSRYFMGLSQVFPNLLPQVYIHIYCALAQAGQGDYEAAAGELQAALDLALPDRVYLPFAENFGALCPLLPLVKLTPRHRKGIEHLAACFSHGGTGDQEEDFTPREREILALLKEGRTNREIAERMNLSPNTIRNGVSAMLKKRGFRSRIQLQALQDE